jgi:hypothetical protein
LTALSEKLTAPSEKLTALSEKKSFTIFYFIYFVCYKKSRTFFFGEGSQFFFIYFILFGIFCLPTHVVRPCSKNGSRKIAQNSIEVDAKTNESTRKAVEELDGSNKEGHERKKPKRRPVGR